MRITWTPIGIDLDNPFTGIFDGAGHKIKNLYISDSVSISVGLFGFVGGGTVKNVGIVGGKVIGSANVNDAGGVGGVNGDSVENCYSGKGASMGIGDGDGTFSFTQPAGSVTIEVTFVFVCDGGLDCPGSGYDDLGIAMWYHEAVDYTLKNSLMNGMDNGEFSPGTALSRAMLAQILYNHAGQPKVSGSSAFSDVVEGAWYENAVIWAAEGGVVLGDGNGQFGPNDPITREQLAAMLWRYAGRPEAAGAPSGFVDTGAVSTWAAGAMAWAVERGIMEGKGDGILDPRGEATRAEAAALLMRFLTRS